MALRLHHLNASRSQRIVWLLAELGVEHEIISYQRDAVTRLAPTELLKIHPMGKSPLLEHDGLVIAETGAIAEYLLAKFDPNHRLHPAADSPDFARYLEWVHATEGATFLPFLLPIYLGAAGVTAGPVMERVRAEQAKAFGVIEAHLTKHAYFAGANFSAADCLMGFQLQMAEGALPAGSAMAKWLENVKNRAGYKKMLQVGI